jgi:dTDP-4-dehydrorhamnose reductase
MVAETSMKILVTGGNGQLGRAFRAIKGEFYDIHCLDIDQLDFTNSQEVEDVINRIEPDVVIHAGAYTDVEKAESDILNTLKINVTGTQRIAEICTKNNIEMVYISTDYIFDGEKDNPYKESDSANPLNIYGLSKLHGEDAVKYFCSKYFIVRTSWLFGRGNNFVQSLLNLTNTQKSIKVVNDQTGSPTYAPDLARAILLVIKLGEYGTYHITNSGSCTWYEYAQEIIRITNNDVELIPINTEEFNQIAKRPKYSVLDNSKLKDTIGYDLDNWKNALLSYLIDIKKI